MSDLIPQTMVIESGGVTAIYIVSPIGLCTGCLFKTKFGLCDNRNELQKYCGRLIDSNVYYKCVEVIDGRY